MVPSKQFRSNSSYYYSLASKFPAYSQVSCFERIWESEAAFEPVITNALINLLDNVSNRTETPHEEVTAEIIDHKLYPLVYNRTLVAHNRLSGRVYQPVPPPTSPDVMYATSRRFACLPTDVFVSEENFKILSRSNLCPTSIICIQPFIKTYIAIWRCYWNPSSPYSSIH